MTATLEATRAGDAPPASGRPGRRARFQATGWPTYLLLIGLALIYILPFLIQIATSFKTEPEAAVNPIGLIPENWTTAAYERLFRFSDYLLWGTNSIIVTLFVTLGRVFFSFAFAAGLVLLVPFAMVIVGLPAAAVVRGLIEIVQRLLTGTG